jgi:hypothetical protein
VERVERRTGEATDAALDGVECAASDRACAAKAPAAAAEPSAASPAAGSAAAPAPRRPPVPGVPRAWPRSSPARGRGRTTTSSRGSRILFADDFSADEVGNFPKRMEFVAGTMEIVEWQGRRWLSAGNNGELYIPLPEVLPSASRWSSTWRAPATRCRSTSTGASR